MAKKLAFNDYMKAKKGGASYEDYADMAKGMGASCMSKGEFEQFVKKGELQITHESEDEDEDKGDDGGEGGGENDEGDEAEKARKSQVGVSDLMKSIRDYEAVESATTTAGGSRESYLRARLDSNVITKSELAELGRLWANVGTAEPEPLRKSLRDTMDHDAAALVDASDFLDGLVKSVDASLERVEAEVTRDGLATRTLLKAQGSLIKSLAQVAANQNELIKSLVERVEVVETTPAPRRSITANPRDVRERPLAKSTTGDRKPRDPNALTKSQVDLGLRTLVQKAADAGDDQALDRLIHATAKFEAGNSLPDNILQAIRMTVGG